MTDQSKLMAGHLVLDIETFGIKKGAAVASIGAVCGDNSFYAVVSPTIGEIERETFDWWKSDKTSYEAFDEVFHPANVYTLENVLRDFLAFIEMTQPKYFWGNSPDFDFGHLERWLNFYGLEIPWSYWQMRDIRTIKDFVSVEEVEKIKAKYTPHIAIEDAKAERDILKAFLLSNTVRYEQRD